MPKQTKQEVAEPQESVEVNPSFFPEHGPYRIPVQLGFGPAPLKKYVFVGYDEMDAKPYVWYSLENDRVSPIFHQAVVGYIAGIRVVPKIYKDRLSYKIDITILADQEYVVRSGSTTTFSKYVVNQLSAIQDFSKPYALMASAGDSDKVVFGALLDLDTRTRVQFEGEARDQLQPLVQNIQEILGCEIQTPEMIAAEAKKLAEAPAEQPKRAKQENSADAAF